MLLGSAVLTTLAEVLAPISAALVVIGLWLVAKDWRDMYPATRDTAAWSLGIHRRADGPPAPALSNRVPALAGLATAVAGAINVASAMTSELPARVQTLLAWAPTGEVRLAHALALPSGLALITLARPLSQRRRGALNFTVGLLVLLGILNLAKGLDVEEAALSWALAAVLWHNRATFWVRHEAASMARALRWSAALLAVAAGTAITSVAAAASHAVGGLPLHQVPAAALSLLTLSGGPSFRAPFGWLPLALGILGAGTGIAAVLKILSPVRSLAAGGVASRLRAATLVRRYGGDTLGAFKLREDLWRRFSPDGRAMAAYKVEAGTMLMAGDPVGPEAAVPGLLDDLLALSRRQGLAFAAIGASEEFSVAARQAGLLRLYLGDEAIIATGSMDLSGGRMKSLRKAVNRIERNNYTASLMMAAELDSHTLTQLREVSASWRDGAPERGFSMTHDVLVDELLPDAVVIVARDGDGRIRGFLHFVPVFGRPLMSLSFMRRDRDTPNGLSDFLVVKAAELLGERGVQEFSLNFAMCGRWLRDPANIAERQMAKLLRAADRWFQIERLLRFNVKFNPRWQPRYLLFEHPSQLPRVAVAALWAEGQLPRPRLPSLARQRAIRPQPASI